MTFSDVLCIFLGQEMVKGRPCMYIMYGYCLQLGKGVLFFATSCLLYTDTVHLTSKLDYFPVCVNDFAPADRYTRRYWIDKSSILRSIYHDLTDDSSSAPTAAQKAVDEGCQE